MESKSDKPKKEQGKTPRKTKILAVGAMKEKDFRDQIRILTDVGFSASEIAEITGKNVNTVNVTKTLMKKKKAETNKNEVDKEDV